MGDFALSSVNVLRIREDASHNILSLTAGAEVQRCKDI